MGRTDDPFYTPKLILRLAKPDLDDFDAGCDAFFNKGNVLLKGGNFEAFAREDAYTGEIVHGVRIVSDIPEKLERDAMRLVSDIRNALDKATHAASISLDSADPAYAHFPHGESESWLEGQLKRAATGGGPFRGIPEELHPFLLGLRPYWGGNDLLRAFCAISNPNKHESVVAIGIHFHGIAVGGYAPYREFTRVGTVWNKTKDECEVFRVPRGHKIEPGIEMPAYLTFNDAKGLTGKQFSPTIRDLLGIAESIVLGLEAETARILRERT